MDDNWRSWLVIMSGLVLIAAMMFGGMVVKKYIEHAYPLPTPAETQPETK